MKRGVAVLCLVATAVASSIVATIVFGSSFWMPPQINYLRQDTRITKTTRGDANNDDGHEGKQIPMNTNTKSWQDWPGVAFEEVGHELVFKGSNFVSKMSEILAGNSSDASSDGQSIKTLLDEFLEVYRNRPDKVNMCGIRINHAIALFVSVRHLNPSLVVESGVNAGQSTYFIRAASPTTKIFAIDPLDKAICNQGTRWMDSSDLTTYFTGPKEFKDLVDFDWKGMADKHEIDPKTTLIFIDDHLNLLQRLPPLFEAGIRHVIVEDNYKLGEGATQGDKNGTPKQLFSGRGRHPLPADGEWLFQNLVSYAEFPPIVPPIVAKESTEPRKKAGGFMVASDKNEDIVAPLWRPDIINEDKEKYEDLAKSLGHDPLLKDMESYMQFMNYNQICYMELLPMAPSLVHKFSSSASK